MKKDLTIKPAYYANHQTLQYACVDTGIELIDLKDFTYLKEEDKSAKHVELIDNMETITKEEYEAVVERFNQIVYQTANMGNDLLNQMKYGESFVNIDFKVNLRDLILHIDQYISNGQTYSVAGISAALSMLFKDLYEKQHNGKEMFFSNNKSLAYINPQNGMFRLFDLTKKKVYPQIISSKEAIQKQIGIWSAYRTSRKEFHQSVRSSGFIAAGCKVRHMPTNEISLVLGVNTNTQKVALGGYPALIADLADCEFYETRRQLTGREIQQRKVMYKGHWDK